MRFVSSVTAVVVVVEVKTNHQMRSSSVSDSEVAVETLFPGSSSVAVVVGTVSSARYWPFEQESMKKIDS